MSLHISDLYHYMVYIVIIFYSILMSLHSRYINILIPIEFVLDILRSSTWKISLELERFTLSDEFILYFLKAEMTSITRGMIVY